MVTRRSAVAGFSAALKASSCLCRLTRRASRRRASLWASAGAALFAAALAPTASKADTASSTDAREAHRPNIAIILLDDAGFAATSMFGGLAETPAFERLAKTGIVYNRFNVTAICSPTRAALLSGRNPHQVGFGQIPETAANAPGYNSIWPKSAASLAEHLRRLGYGTAAFGKWHNTPAWEWSPAGPFDHWPMGLGFDYFYGTIGTTSAWEPLLWRGSTPVAPKATAAQGYNLTADLVDDAVRWLHTRETLAPETPYFMYFATTATHSPHQVPDKWIIPYRGRFDAGWDALRPAIFAREKVRGLVPPDAVLTPRDKVLPAWSSLSPDEKRVAERQMEILAGFMTQTDHEVERLVDAIRHGPDGGNTLIVFIAGDNGSSGEDGPEGCDDCPAPAPAARLRLNDLDTLAGPDHIAGSAAGWAFMNDTPFPGMKRQAAYLGGVREPLVISWPGHTTHNDQVRSQWLDVTDVAPTIYDLLGYTPPHTLNGVKQLPMAGTSFASSLTRPDAPSTHHVQYFETFGTRSIYQDGWMASLRYYARPWGRVGQGPQPGAQQWELYDIDHDFSQSRDLAATNPDKLRQMVGLFDIEAKRNDVYPAGQLHIWFEQMPSLSWRRSHFVYYPDAPILSWDAIPDFERAHVVTARLHLPNGRARGLVFSSGMRGRGFALYMQGGKLIYEVEQGARTTRVMSATPIPQGAHEIKAEISQGEFGTDVVRTVALYVDGNLTARGKVPQSDEPFYGSSTLSVGVPQGSPVSPSRPQTFSGTIDKVELTLTSPPLYGSVD